MEQSSIEKFPPCFGKNYNPLNTECRKCDLSADCHVMAYFEEIIEYEKVF